MIVDWFCPNIEVYIQITGVSCPVCSLYNNISFFKVNYKKIKHAMWLFILLYFYSCMQQNNNKNRPFNINFSGRTTQYQIFKDYLWQMKSIHSKKALLKHKQHWHSFWGCHWEQLHSQRQMMTVLFKFLGLKLANAFLKGSFETDKTDIHRQKCAKKTVYSLHKWFVLSLTTVTSHNPI